MLGIEKRFLRAKTWKSIVGWKDHGLCLTDIVIYSYMWSEWQDAQKEGRTYSESQEAIAQACGVSRKKVNALVGVLRREGVIETHKEKHDTGVSLVYDVIHPLLVKDEQGVFSVGRKNI